MSRSRIVSRSRRGETGIEGCEAIIKWPDPPIILDGPSPKVELSEWVLVELDANPGVFYPAFEKDALRSALLEILRDDDRVLSAISRFRSLMADWKNNSGSKYASEYEAKVSKVLDLKEEIRGPKKRKSFSPTEAESKAIHTISDLSQLYLQTFHPNSPNLFRGLSYNLPKIARDIFETPPENLPVQFRTRTTALVNFTVDEETAKDYGLLYTSASFPLAEIPIVPDGLFYEEDHHDRNNDGECQVAGNAFESVYASELLTPETDTPLTETLKKIRSGGSCSSDDLSLAEHQVMAGLIIRMAEDEVTVTQKTGIDVIQDWVDSYLNLNEIDRKTIIEGAKADIEKVDFGFIGAVGFVTEDEIEYEIEAIDPEEIF